MKAFDYAAPKTVDDAVRLLAEHDGRAKILAGGTDIIVQLREGLREADLVVDVKKIDELMELRFDERGGLWLGASVPCYRVYEDDRVVRDYAGLVDAARIIGGWQIQSRASIGGNLCNSSPAADSIPPLIAYDAICHIAGPGGRRTVAAAKFCTAPGRNVLQRGEMLVALEFPPSQSRSAAAYQRFIPRNEMDIAVVGAASWVRLNESQDGIEEARIALAAVAPTPVRRGSVAVARRPARHRSDICASRRTGQKGRAADQRQARADGIPNTFGGSADEANVGRGGSTCKGQK